MTPPKNDGPFFWIILPAILLAGLSFFLRLKSIQQTTYATGWDAYFYLAQIKSFGATGEWYILDVSLFYPILLLLEKIGGNNILAYQINAAIISSLFVGLAYFLAKQWSESFFIGLLIGCFFLFSPHLTFFTAQYPKHLLGLCFFLGFLLTLKSNKWWWSLALLILNFFVHKMTMGLSLVFGLVYFFFNSIQLKKVSIQRNPVITLFVSVMVLTAISMTVPGILNWSDLHIFQNAFSPIPHFAPYSFFSELGMERIDSFWFLELVLTAALFVLVIPVLLKAPQRSLMLALFLLCTILVFPFFKWEIPSIAQRFYLVFVLLCPFFIPLVIGAEEARKNKIIITIISIALMFGSIFTYSSYQANLHNPDYKKLEEITAEATKYLQDKSPDLVIAHQGLAAYFTYKSGINTFGLPSKNTLDSTHIYRIATGIRYSLLEQYFTSDEMKEMQQLTSRYFLIPENLWQKLLKEIVENKDQILLEQLSIWKNPRSHIYGDVEEK